jgi:O-antigen/teichoic acid export membrane protein
MFKQKIFANILRHQIITSSAIVFGGSMLVNVLNYLFTLLVGRILTPSEFGEVVVLFSLMVITSVPSVAIKTVVAKYAAELKSQNRLGQIRKLFRRFTIYSWIVGLIMLVGFWLAAPLIAAYLRVELWAFLIFALAVPLTLAMATNKGLFQGTQNFVSFSVIDLVAAGLKLGLGIFFAMLGYSVLGVMAATVTGLVVGYLVGLFIEKIQQRQQFPADAAVEHEPNFSLRQTWAFSSGVFWATFLITLFVNIDIILVKHYLSPAVAGQYSALATVGKLITYGTTSFITVMFPMVASEVTGGKNKGEHLLRISLIIIGISAVMVLMILAIFPRGIVEVLLGSEYMEIAPYLAWFGLGVTFVTLATVIVNYFMACGNTRFIYPLLFSIALQIVMVMLFHDNLAQLTGVMNAVGASLLIGMVITLIKYRATPAVET